MTSNYFDLLAGILLCQSRLVKKLDSNLGALHGLGTSEYQVLHHLNATAHPLSRIQLAEKIGLTASGTTRLLQPMEKIGLVSKQPDQRDARLSLVTLSHSGEETYKNALQSFTQVMESAVEISPSQQPKLLALLSKIA